jgi:hypothetical protein
MADARAFTSLGYQGRLSLIRDGTPHLIWQGISRPWSLAGYGVYRTIAGSDKLITPPVTIAALQADYGPGART